MIPDSLSISVTLGVIPAPGSPLSRAVTERQPLDRGVNLASKSQSQHGAGDAHEDRTPRRPGNFISVFWY